MGLSELERADFAHSSNQMSGCTDWGSVKRFDCIPKMFVLLQKKSYVYVAGPGSRSEV